MERVLDRCLEQKLPVPAQHSWTVEQCESHQGGVVWWLGKWPLESDHLDRIPALPLEGHVLGKLLHLCALVSHLKTGGDDITSVMGWVRLG